MLSSVLTHNSGGLSLSCDRVFYRGKSKQSAPGMSGWKQFIPVRQKASLGKWSREVAFNLACVLE